MSTGACDLGEMNEQRKKIAERVAQYNPLGIFEVCPICEGEMRPEHAHYRCRACGWRDSCCD